MLKSILKMQEMPFQRPKFQKFSGGGILRTPYNCVVIMASPWLKSWLRYWNDIGSKVEQFFNPETPVFFLSLIIHISLTSIENWFRFLTVKPCTQW